MTFAILASGPSLVPEDCEKVRHLKTIAINCTFRMAPWANYLYACDPWFWQHHLYDVRRIFKGECWTQDKQAAQQWGLHYIPSVNLPGLGKHGFIHQGKNSGYQAINLAYQWRAKRIILLGFDMKKSGRNTHWHNPHKNDCIQPFEIWIRAMDALAKDLKREGVEVLNASRETALECFPRVSLDEIDLFSS